MQIVFLICMAVTLFLAEHGLGVPFETTTDSVKFTTTYKEIERTISHETTLNQNHITDVTRDFVLQSKGERIRNKKWQVLKREAGSSVTTLFVASSFPSSSLTSTNPVVSTTSLSYNTGSYVTSHLENLVHTKTITRGIVIETTANTKIRGSSISVSMGTTSLRLASSLAQEALLEKVQIKPTSYPHIIGKLVTKRQLNKNYKEYRHKVIASRDNSFSGNLLEPIATNEVPKVFSRYELPVSIPMGVAETPKLQTNKYYANLFLGNQSDMIWSYPYGLSLSNKDYYGFELQHSIPQYRYTGTVNTNNPTVKSYYANPLHTGELIFSADSFTSELFMTLNELNAMSVLVTLYEDQLKRNNFIEIPVVQGMGFVTSIYHGNLIPKIHSRVGIKAVAKLISSTLSPNTTKYRITLVNSVEYLAYITVPNNENFEFTGLSWDTITGSGAVDGLIIQFAVAPSSTYYDSYYNQAAGLYTTHSDFFASAKDGKSAEYGFTYSLKGSSKSGKPMIFTLPHHIYSFDEATNSSYTGIIIPSTTKGNMYGYLTSELRMREALDRNVQFLPWLTQLKKKPIFYSPEQLRLIGNAINKELAIDIKETVTSLNSTYFAGKALDKYAYILLVLNDIIGDKDLIKSTLETLKGVIAVYVHNRQHYPLMYDTKFGGLTSTAYQEEGSLADFGSSYYNDHHFHYGYFVHAAAVIGYVDNQYGGNWVEKNKDWVNSLIRDVANPSSRDTYFPTFRMFDWFHGHSWASGLFPSPDGKNEESSSEDYNFSYGMKLWGKVSGDERMELRGDLMLAVMSRSMNIYFLYASNNTIEPSYFIGNKVAGILHDNKINYDTYFGHPDYRPEYVHGIHMLPITPASSLIRRLFFVKEEWENQIKYWVDEVQSNWAGILRLNEALFNPSGAYEFFSSLNFKTKYLDDGQSLTWCLAYTAALSNAEESKMLHLP
ncbi:uncharacterized protein PRCAT00001481001 [Priceomyces carsonii]|uniref:uncharacterized protein n=1 Tax=Priceomyces carsonii TaxID=28549 RepID=UPI002EDB6902|nr:unnamed protein product [Priceomyces carsonii]